MDMDMDENNDFSNLFNDDFFKKHMLDLNLDGGYDKNGKIDYTKLKDEFFKRFGELNNNSSLNDLFATISSDKFFPKFDDGKVSVGFIQDLNNVDAKDKFDKLIEEHDLVKTSDIIDINGVDYVNEMWSNKEGTVNVKRVYILDGGDEKAPQLTKLERIGIYETKMMMAVEVEDYEKAAQYRDQIKQLKNEE